MPKVFFCSTEKISYTYSKKKKNFFPKQKSFLCPPDKTDLPAKEKKFLYLPKPKTFLYLHEKKNIFPNRKISYTCLKITILQTKILFIIIIKKKKNISYICQKK